MRPTIICHMVSSVDGRLIADRWTPPAHGIANGLVLRVYEGVAAQLGAQGWIVGRKTMADLVKGPFRDGLPAAPAARRVSRETFVAVRGMQSLAVVIDPTGKLQYSQAQIASDHIVAVLGEHVPDSYLAALRDTGISYVFAGADGSDLSQALQSLRSYFNVETLLLEGGGIINGAFLAQGLIDELSLLIYPGIDGLSDAPSIFEYHGEPNARPAEGRALRYLGSETLEGGMVWLRYRFEGVTAEG
jgi:riboflavin biosynthesis pyrimidine reductase